MALNDVIVGVCHFKEKHMTSWALIQIALLLVCATACKHEGMIVSYSVLLPVSSIDGKKNKLKAFNGTAARFGRDFYSNSFAEYSFSADLIILMSFV